jgi:hypothetical protein
MDREDGCCLEMVKSGLHPSSRFAVTPERWFVFAQNHHMELGIAPQVNNVATIRVVNLLLEEQERELLIKSPLPIDFL